MNRKLTERENEVLELLRKGLTVPQVAKKLVLTEEGVKYHKYRIYKKFGVHTNNELMADYIKELETKVSFYEDYIKNERLLNEKFEIRYRVV